VDFIRCVGQQIVHRGVRAEVARLRCFLDCVQKSFTWVHGVHRSGGKEQTTGRSDFSLARKR
jgi:hypothetical protein